MRQFPNLFAGAAVFAALFVSGPTKAAIVFSNFGPFNSFADNGLLLQGESVGTIANVDQASSFTVGASDYVLTSVSLGINVSSGPTIVGTGPLDIIVAANAGGLPGAELKTFALNVNTTGKQIVTGAGGLDLLLHAGTTYWIIADARGTFNGGWNFNAINDLGATAGRSGPTGNPIEGPWSLHNPGDRFAFRVEGRAVPEPASLGLLALGTLVLMPRKRRRMIAGAATK